MSTRIRPHGQLPAHVHEAIDAARAMRLITSICVKGAEHFSRYRALSEAFAAVGAYAADRQSELEREATRDAMH